MTPFSVKCPWGRKCIYNTNYSKAFNFNYVAILINHQGKYRNFTVTKPGRYHCNQVTKVNVTNSKIQWHHVPIDRTLWKIGHNITADVLLQRVHYPNLIIRKHRTNWSGRMFYKMTNQCCSKKKYLTRCQGHERQRLKHRHRLDDPRVKERILVGQLVKFD